MTRPGRAGWLVVTDLDGTLLDERSYGFEPAREALEALRVGQVPFVLATSKTQAEVDALVRALGLRAGAIVENGGAVLLQAADFARVPAGARREGDMLVLELGLGRRELVRHLQEIAAEVGVGIRGFAALPVEEVARLTGLPESAARLANERAFDEPFVLVDDGAAERLVMDAARRRGLDVTTGGRFHHLVGVGTSKGRALRRLLDAHAAEGRAFTTVGLGDAGNDLSFLEAVDCPVVIPRPDGSIDRHLLRALPHAARAPAPGPAGWNAAVLAILSGRPLARVAEAVS